MGSAASTLSPDAQAAIKSLPESAQAALGATSALSAEAAATLKTLPANVHAELMRAQAAAPGPAPAASETAPARSVADMIESPSIAERIAAPVYHPFRWEEAAESVGECEGTGGTALILPKMIELSAALLDLPRLATIEITGGTFELLARHKAAFATDGWSEKCRELLAAERTARLVQLAPLTVEERRAMAEAVCGCCNDEHRPRVASTLGALLKGDVRNFALVHAHMCMWHVACGMWHVARGMCPLSMRR